jgi:hypothetical protein
VRGREAVTIELFPAADAVALDAWDELFDKLSVFVKGLLILIKP